MINKLSFSTLLLTLLLAGGSAEAASPTMRLDYYHTGNATQEMFSLDRVAIEPLPWPGNPRKNIDETNLGKYLFEVRDRTTNRLLYSRGFASIYGEWETTDEARNVNRSFHESLRFPAPQAPVQIVLKKRDANNAFREIWSTIVDPKDIFVDTSKHPAPGPLIEIQKSGDPAVKVDFLILGDGYTAAERGKFDAGVLQHLATPADLRLAQPHRFMNEGFRELGAMQCVHETALMALRDAWMKTAGWAKAQRAVPTIFCIPSLLLGTLRFAHPTIPGDA